MIALVLLLWGCTGSDEPAGDAHAVGKVETFETTGCKATQLIAPRPVTGTMPDWAPPATKPTHLVDSPLTVTGEAPSGQGTLLSYDEAEIRGWTKVLDKRERIFVGPDVNVPEPRTMRLVVRPGGSKNVHVVVSPKPVIDKQNLARRRISFTLDRDAAPDEPVVLTGAVSPAMIGNWGDDRSPPKDALRAFRLVFDKAQPPPVVERFEVYNELAAFSDAAAGAITVERAEVLRPSWFANAGATVRATVDVPADSPELRWHDGGIGGAKRVVVVKHDGEPQVVAALTTPSDDWTAHSVDLSRWAGKSVEIELTNSGEGVALMGDPRVLSAQPTAAPDVIVVLLDTMRADHVGAWGSPVADVTPTLDGLAGSGLQFAHAVSTSPWTKPAIPSLMTGLRPTTHRVGNWSYGDKLPVGVPVLQEQMRAAGWRTGSFSSSPLGSTLSGLERGFDTAMPPRAWKDHKTKLGHVTADLLTDGLMDWWKQEPDQPIFAYVHTLEVHGWRRALYSKPPRGMSTYDYAVHDADEKLGGLIDALKARQTGRDTLVVVMSDHGEGFGDHGKKDHGTALYHSQIHIPLVFWADGALPSGAVTDPVGLADVPVTVLDLVGAPALPDAAGKSLKPYFDGTASAPVHDGLPSARVKYVWQPTSPRWHTMIAPDGRKAIRIEGKIDRTFDLAADLCEGQTAPDKTGDLYERMDAHVAAERVAAKAFDERFREAEANTLDAGDVELLKELGYLEE